MRIHHIALRTRDLARLERFYMGVLGLTPTRRQDDRSVWLDAGGTILMLEHAEAGEPSTPAGSYELVAFALAAGEHAAAMERLEAAGVGVEARTGSTLYLRDPDGRRVGLSAWPDMLP
jgi:catechol 2,3-dioxygenase-like lactoylglutathione lyase family enzyme